MDEFALRRGHTYATVLVNMATHRPVDVLADRCADTLAAWLQDHPDIEVICRDRAGPYADGATRGALQATQVADRWHLLHNLTDVVERVAKRHRAALREDPDPNHTTAAPVAVVEGPRATTTRQRYAQVHALADRGINLTTICQTLGLDPKTVRRYQRAANPEELLAPAAQRATALDVHKPYLARRFGDGCTNAARLWDELRQQGYHGSRRSVRRYLNTLRAGTPQPNPLPPLPVRTFRRLVLRRPDRLDPRDRARLDAVAARCATLATTVDLAQDFAWLLRERHGDRLATWVEHAEASDMPELRAFALGLRRDWDAVTAELTLPWRSGAVEGHVNRVKMLKRQMYGRAKFDLLPVD